jgi:Lon protease-like protein
MSPFQLKFESLPPTLPIFPLAQAIVLPGSQLPLNIFEQRYLNMVLDALGAQRLIGMIQPSSADDNGETLFGVGCAGRISSFGETADGRLLIVLTGVCRFDMGEELPTTRGYRRVEVGWERFSADYAATEPQGMDHDTLEGHLRPYCQQRGLEVDWEAVQSMQLGSSVDFFSMNLPFAPPEKQALLEAENIGQRASLLMGFADMALADDGGGHGARH